MTPSDVYELLCQIIEYNPTLRQCDKMELPKGFMYQYYYQFNNDVQGFSQYSFFGPLGPIAVKESPDNKIRFRYRKEYDITTS